MECEAWTTDPSFRNKSLRWQSLLAPCACSFSFQPSLESTYFGDGDHHVVHARSGLLSSPWLTYDSDSGRSSDAAAGAKSELKGHAAIHVRSWSWPFLASGIALLCAASRHRTTFCGSRRSVRGVKALANPKQYSQRRLSSIALVHRRPVGRVSCRWDRGRVVWLAVRELAWRRLPRLAFRPLVRHCGRAEPGASRNSNGCTRSRNSRAYNGCSWLAVYS